MRVEIYFNLHKKVFSMRHKGKVIAHVCKATLKDVSYVVQPAGRARVLSDKKKNVHAFVRGELVDGLDAGIYKEGYVSYNPYKAATFVDNEGSAMYNSDIACLDLGVSGKPYITAMERVQP